MANILFIIAEEDFKDTELEIPKKILEEKGHTCVVGSTSLEKCKGMDGLEIKPNVDISTEDVPDYDAVVVVGGSGSPSLIGHPEVLELVKGMYNANKVVAAICLGPMVLAKSGILKDKKVTFFKDDDSSQVLSEAGAEIVDANVVVDGKIITASGPQAAEEFGKKIAELLR